MKTLVHRREARKVAKGKAIHGKRYEQIMRKLGPYLRGIHG